MVWIPGGTFLMGCHKHYPEEAPAHEATVDGFWIDQHTVANEEFCKFVEATKHVTSAERAPKGEDYPAAKLEPLVPASVVFNKPRRRVDLRDCYNWYRPARACPNPSIRRPAIWAFADIVRGVFGARKREEFASRKGGSWVGGRYKAILCAKDNYLLAS